MKILLDLLCLLFRKIPITSNCIKVAESFSVLRVLRTDALLTIRFRIILVWKMPFEYYIKKKDLEPVSIECWFINSTILLDYIKLYGHYYRHIAMSARRNCILPNLSFGSKFG